jgi:hypothetical protein
MFFAARRKVCYDNDVISDQPKTTNADNLQRLAIEKRHPRVLVTIGAGSLVVLLLLVSLFVYKSIYKSTTNITVTGLVEPALAACNRHAARVQVIQSRKQLYVLKANGQVRYQQQLLRAFGRLVSVTGSVKGTQAVCRYGKSQPTAVLWLSKLETM